MNASCYELQASSCLKYMGCLIFLLGTGAISYCGLHFLWKIVLWTLWIAYLFHLKKRVTTAHFNFKDLNDPVFISSWLLVLKGPIIICQDQTERENWCQWIFKAKSVLKASHNGSRD